MRGQLTVLATGLANLPADVEARQFGPWLSALVGGLSGQFLPVDFSKTLALLDQLLGVRSTVRRLQRSASVCTALWQNQRQKPRRLHVSSRWRKS